MSAQFKPEAAYFNLQVLTLVEKAAKSHVLILSGRLAGKSKEFVGILP
jgi:hypothetical protein